MIWDDDGLRAEVGAAQRRERLRWGLAIAALLGLLSIFSGGLFLYAAIVVGLALGLSTLITITSLRKLEVERKLSAVEVAYGGVVEAWLIVRNRKSLPAPGLLWRDQIDPGLDVEGPTSCAISLAGDGQHKLVYRLHSTRRGLFRVGPAVVEATGPFGLMRRFLVDRQARFITVLPRAVDIGQGWPLGHRPIHQVPRRHSLFEDPSRFQGIRDFRHGDSLRRVHWRATARSGTLQIKLFEPAVLEGALLVVDMSQSVYSTPGKSHASEAFDDGLLSSKPLVGEPLEELTVTAAASLGAFVLAGGQAMGLLSNGTDAAERYPTDWTGGTFRRLDEALEASGPRRKVTAFRPLELAPGKGSWQLEHLFKVLARLVPAQGPGLPELLLAEIPHLPRSLVLMIVTPRVDEALAGAIDALRRSGIEVAVVWIGADASAGATLGSVPVYPVNNESDLEALGGQRL